MLVADILVSRGEHYGVRSVLLKVIWRSVSFGSLVVIVWLCALFFRGVCVTLVGVCAVPASGRVSDTVDI